MSDTSTTQQETNLAVTVERLPNCKVKLTAVIPAAATKSSWTKAVKGVNKEVVIPGFRKGHAPEARVIARYESHIKKTFEDNVVNDNFVDAIKANDMHPLGGPSHVRSHIVSCDRENGATITYEFEVLPESPELPLSALPTTKFDSPEATTEDLKKEYQNIQRYTATQTEVTGRPAKEGDIAYLSITRADDSFESLCENAPFPLTKGETSSWIVDAVLGKNIGDAVQATSSWDYEVNPELNPQFRPTDCLITLVNIKERHLPEINDELAKKLGQESAATLDTWLKGKIVHEKTLKAKESFRQELTDALVANSTFELPSLLVGDESTIRFRRHMEALQKETEDQKLVQDQRPLVEAKVRREADVFLKIWVHARKWAFDNNITYQPKEMMRIYQEHAQFLPIEQRLILADTDGEALRNRVINLLTVEKFLDQLVDVQAGIKSSMTVEATKAE